MNEDIRNPDQPAESSTGNNEISEEDLEQVSGGITPIPIPEGKIGKFAGDLTQIKLNTANLNSIVIKDTGKV